MSSASDQSRLLLPPPPPASSASSSHSTRSDPPAVFARQHHTHPPTGPTATSQVTPLLDSGPFPIWFEKCADLDLLCVFYWKHKDGQNINVIINDVALYRESLRTDTAQVNWVSNYKDDRSGLRLCLWPTRAGRLHCRCHGAVAITDIEWCFVFIHNHCHNRHHYRYFHWDVTPSKNTLCRCWQTLWPSWKIGSQ